MNYVKTVIKEKGLNIFFLQDTEIRDKYDINVIICHLS